MKATVAGSEFVALDVYPDLVGDEVLAQLIEGRDDPSDKLTARVLIVHPDQIVATELLNEAQERRGLGFTA